MNKTLEKTPSKTTLYDVHEKVIDETSLGYMLKLSAPMIVTFAAFTVMQFVDRFMVSRLGTEALAAILPAGIVTFLPASFLLGVMSSVNTYVSQNFGRGDLKNCSNYCWQAIYLGFIYFTFVLLFMWPTAPQIFQMMGHTPEVIKLEVIYLRILLYGQLLCVLIWATSRFFMGIHRPAVMMYAALVAQLINIIANYLLIFGKFGFPALGIAGAGWGTFIGLAFEAGILMAFFLSSQINEKYASRHTLKIDLLKIRDLLKVGLGAGIGMMVNVSLFGMILFAMVGKFGKEAVAASSAVFSCMNVSFIPIVGLSHVLTATVGKAIGQGKKDIAVKQTSLCLKIGVLYMSLMGALLFIFRNELMSFWSSSSLVVEIGTKLLICAAIFQVFDALSITYNGALRGAGDTVWLATVGLIGVSLILGLGGILTIIYLPSLGALGPWIVATLNITFIGLANRWRFKNNNWMKIDLFKKTIPPIPPDVEAVIQ